MKELSASERRSIRGHIEAGEPLPRELGRRLLGFLDGVGEADGQPRHRPSRPARGVGARLRAAEERLSALLDNAVDGIFMKDARRRYTLLNPVAARWMGRPVEELLGRTPEEVFDAESARIVRETDDATFAGEVYSAERELIVAGRRHVFHTVQVPLRDPDGTISVICGIVRDVTARVDAEREAREVQERLRAILEHSPDTVYERDLRADRYTMVSPSVEALTGFPPEVFLGEGLSVTLGRIHADDLPRVRAAEAEVAGGGATRGSVEYRYLRADGEYRWFADHFTVTRGADGGPARWVGTVRDVTEVRRVEEDLRRAAESLALAQRCAGAGVWDWDLVTGKQEWSREFYELLGLDADRDEACLECWRRVVHPDDREVAEARGWEAVKSAGCRENEYRIVLPSGETRWILALGDAVRDAGGNPLRVSGICLDRTAQRSTEEALRRTREQLRRTAERLALAQRCAGAGMWDWDVVSGETEWSPEIYTLFGLDPSRDEPGFDAWRRVLHPEERESAEARTYEAVKAGTRLEHEYRVVLPSGEVRWILALGDTVRDAAGHPLRMCGICLDRTAQKSMEEALRRTREQLAIAQGTRRPGVWDWEIGSGEWRCCEETLRLFGLDGSGGSATYEDWLGAIHPEDREAVVERSRAAVRGRARMESEYRIVLPTGEVRWVLSLGDTSYDPGGGPTRMSGISVDITERKRMEGELRERATQLSRLMAELVGAEHRERRRLAQILHDDIQQQLVGARMHVRAAMAGAGEADRRRLEIAHGALDEALASARSITRDMAPPVLLHGDLGLALSWLVQEMRERHGLEVTARIDGSGGALPEWAVLLLFAAARELLFNVVKHAGVPGAEVRLRRRADRVELEVEDAGAGFDPRSLDVPAGGGGLGLLGLRERIAHAGGELGLESAPGRGTRVRVTLPVRGGGRSRRRKGEGDGLGAGPGGGGGRDPKG